MQPGEEERFFIAIVPPKELQDQINEIKHVFVNQYFSKGALNAPPHITLHMPFLWKTEKIKRLTDALNEICLKNLTFSIQLNGFSHFGERVIFVDVIQNKSLIQLQEMVVSAMKKLTIFNQADDLRGFHPHITVAFRDLKKEQFHLAWNHFQTKKFFQNFQCNQFSLLVKRNKIWEEMFTFHLNAK